MALQADAFGPIVVVSRKAGATQVTVDSTANCGQDSTDDTIECSITISACVDYVVACVGIRDAAKTVSSITWDSGGGDPEGLSHVSDVRGTQIQGEWWELNNPTTTSGTITVSITISANDTSISAAVAALCNTDPTDPSGSPVTQTATDTSISQSATNVASGLVVDCVTVQAPGSALTATGDNTSQDQGAATNGDTTGLSISSIGAGAKTMSWSWTTSNEASQNLVPVSP